LGRLAESAASSASSASSAASSAGVHSAVPSASSASSAASSAGVVGEAPAVNARYGAADAVAVGPLRLRALDLSDTKLSLMWEEGRLTQRPELVSKLLKGLGRAPMLAQLSLGGNMLCELAAKAVSAWLCQPSCRLQSLDFSRNPIGDAGGEQIAKALRTNASLSTLHLDECMLTDATCLQAIKALRRNKGSLKKLTLAWNGIEVLAAPLEQS
jgi:Leucine-rich repeat (LRR) protein